MRSSRPGSQATPLGSIEHQIAWAPDGKIGRWIVGNPAIVLLDGNLFVHGGISPAYAHLPIAEINRQVGAALMARATDPKSIINDPVGPLWYRGLATPNADAAAAPSAGTPATAPPRAEPPVEDQLNALLSAYGAKRIVIGHTPILSGIAMLYGGRLIRIDTGISSVYGGKVSYLEILDGNPIPHVVEQITATHEIGSTVMRLVSKAALAAAAFSILSWSTSAIAADKPKPLFASDDVINLTLSGPITGISRNADAKPVPGVLKVDGSRAGNPAGHAVDARHHAAA